MIQRLALTLLLTCSSLVAAPSLHAQSNAAAGETPTTAPTTAPSDASGDISETPAFSFSGFGTLGLAHTQGHGAAFIRDLTQPRGASNRGLSFAQDSRIGVQANLSLGNNLEAVTQILSRYRNNNSFDPEITWGFLKYTFNDQIEIRAGRIGFDAYIAADSRDIGYSYLWVRPPVEYYGPLFFPYEDGGDILFRTPIADGVGRIKFYSGVTRQKLSSLMEQREWAGGIRTPAIGSIEDLEQSRVLGGHIEFQNNHWTVRLGEARLYHTSDFAPGAFDLQGILAAQAMVATAGDPGAGIAPNPQLGNALQSFARDANTAGKKITMDSLAVAYEDGPLQTSMAISHLSGNAIVFPNIKSAYFLLGYRFGALTPYAVLSTVKAKKSDRSDILQRLGANPAIIGITNFLATSPLATQTTHSLGLRYDFAENIALKFQADFIRNRDCSPVALPIGSSASCAPPLLWPTVPVNWNGRAQVYTATLDFTF